MKNILFLSLLAFLSFNLVAQENINLESDLMNARFYETDKIPIIKVKLKNYTPDEFKDLEIKYVLVSLGQRKEEYVDVNANGQFEIKLTHPYAYQQLWLFLGDYYYGQIIAHKELVIEADLRKLKKKKAYMLGKGIQFKGPDAELNTYFNKFVTFKRQEKNKYYKTFQSIITDRELSGKEKRKKYVENYQIWNSVLIDYIQKYPSKYATLLKNESDAYFYGWLFTLDRQQDIQDELIQKGLKHQPLIVSNDGTAYYRYMTFMLKSLSPEANIALMRKMIVDKDIVKDNQEKFDLFLVQYQLRLERKQYDKAIFAEGDSLFLAPNKELLKSAKLAAFREKIEQLEQKKADLVKLSGAPEDKWEQEIYYNYMLPFIKTPWVRSLMQQSLKEAIAYTEVVDKTLEESTELTTSSSLGTSLQSFPFGANLYKSEVADAQTLIASIQNAFPNKSIILDVWTTWCGPCIYDMKNSVETKKALKTLSVEVVYLCVEDNSTQKKWTKTVAELKTSGNHIFLEKKLAKSVMKFFDLKGYPSHIFIDKKGEWDTNFIHSLANLELDKLKKKL